MGWRDDPATDKQLAFAESISNAILCDPFTGKTKGEACDYISEHKSEYDEACKEMNDYCMELYLADLHEDAGDRV